jgi:hypothetical protein
MSALSEWNTFSPRSKSCHNSVPPLLYLLAFICALFISILIFCYVVAKHANPVLLDSQGHPVTRNSPAADH